MFQLLSVSAQTFHLSQLPLNGSIVTLTNQPVASYGITASGDELSFTRLRWGLYPLYPLTTDDIGEIAVRGSRGVLAGAFTRADSTALPNFPAVQFTLIPSALRILDSGSETVSLSVQSKPGRRGGIVIVRLEEVVSVGTRTRTTVGLIDGDSFHVGVRFPESRLVLETAARRTGRTEPLREMILRWSAEQGKSYRIETSTDLKQWFTASDGIVAADGEIRFIVPVSPYKTAEFFRLAATATVAPSAAALPQTPTPIPVIQNPSPTTANPPSVPTTPPVAAPPAAAPTSTPASSANSPPYNLTYPKPSLRW